MPKKPDFILGFIEMGEQRKDVDLVTRLKEVRRQMEQYMETLDDSILLAGSEVYSGAQAIYNNIKMAATNKVEGAKTAYDDLRVRFPGRPKASQTS